MNVLVTGAAGFIGSQVAEKLLARGDAVIGLDNFNDYYDPARKRQNEAHLSNFNTFKMIEGDIRDQKLLDEIVSGQGIDCIAHLAAMAGVRNAISQPHLYIEVDYNGTLNLLEAARKGGIGHFVFASTSSVYGDTDRVPFVETDPCDRPLQPYSAAKRASEMLGFTYHHLWGQSFTALRFFTVYGPKGRPDMMAYLTADSIVKGIEIPLYNGGEMWRDWTYVDDIANGVVAAIDRPLGYEVINIGRGEPVLLKDFVSILEELAGKKGNFKTQPKIAADVVKTYANIDKARRLLGYEPKVSVKEGVTRFWEWYITQA